jgi:hypothetical protein
MELDHILGVSKLSTNKQDSLSRTPDTRPGCCGPDAWAPPLARAPTHWCVDPGGETGGNVFILVSPFIPMNVPLRSVINNPGLLPHVMGSGGLAVGERLGFFRT